MSTKSSSSYLIKNVIRLYEISIITLSNSSGMISLPHSPDILRPTTRSYTWQVGETIIYIINCTLHHHIPYLVTRQFNLSRIKILSIIIQILEDRLQAAEERIINRIHI